MNCMLQLMAMWRTNRSSVGIIWPTKTLTRRKEKFREMSGSCTLRWAQPELMEFTPRLRPQRLCARIYQAFVLAAKQGIVDALYGRVVQFLGHTFNKTIYFRISNVKQPNILIGIQQIQILRRIWWAMVGLYSLLSDIDGMDGANVMA
jgi:hypothetical protein